MRAVTYTHRPKISIHAAREGGDVIMVVAHILRKVFQSTPPVKAATEKACKAAGLAFISIHAAREGGDDDLGAILEETDAISIHAAREGGDPCQPLFGLALRISIHAAREGGDQLQPCVRGLYIHFNPRRP